MNDDGAKRRSVQSGRMGRPRGRRSGFAMRIAVVLAALCIAAAVFRMVSSKGRIPQLPRVVLSATEERTATEALRRRTAAFVPSAQETGLVQLFEQMHRAETERLRKGANDKGPLGEQEAFRQAALQAVSLDESRFLLLGDWLALRFQDAFVKVLAHAQQHGIEAVTTEGSEMMRRLLLSGGTFFFRAVKAGAITPDGKLSASQIAPQVLFRVRWRHLAKVRLDEGFSAAEKKAHFDFVAAFASPVAEQSRVRAVSELKRLDKSYDNTVALGIVLHEAGNDKAAYDVVSKTMKNGRKDTALLEFAKALEP